LIPNRVSNWASVIDPKGATSAPPALAKRISMRPCCCFTRLYKRCRSASCIQCVLMTSSDVDIGPLGGEEPCGGQANARACAGNDGDFSFKFSHECFFFFSWVCSLSKEHCFL